MRTLLAVLAMSAGLAAAQDGATLYKQNCATCHDGGMDRAPSRDALKAMSADRRSRRDGNRADDFDGQPAHRARGQFPRTNALRSWSQHSRPTKPGFSIRLGLT